MAASACPGSGVAEPGHPSQGDNLPRLILKFGFVLGIADVWQPKPATGVS
jgi:hypothetical protein